MFKKVLNYKWLEWWIDNFKRPSTWAGIFCIVLSVLIYNDKSVLHLFLEQIVGNHYTIELIMGVISGALIVHKSNEI